MVNGINGTNYAGAVHQPDAAKVSSNYREQKVIDMSGTSTKTAEADLDKPITGFAIEKSTQANETQSQPNGEYIVKKGDSLWRISQNLLKELNPDKKPTNKEIIDMMHKISDANDLGLNKNLKCRTIYPGDKLLIPGEDNKAEDDKKLPDNDRKKPENPPKTDTPEQGQVPIKIPALPKTKPENPPKTDTPEQGQVPIKIPALPKTNTPVKKDKDNGLTPEQRSEARHYGSNVSDYLVGYTDDSEKGLTKEIIKNKVNHKNVMDFLVGYERNKGLGDHFFTQLSTEYGFDEKQNLMKDVALKLSRHLKDLGQDRLAGEVDVILADNGISQKEVARLDEVVQSMMTSIPGLRR